MSSRLNELTLKETIKGLKSKDFSVKELRGSVIERIEEVDKRISAFISVKKDGKEKKSSENLILNGIPFAVKEVLSTRDIKTTASSKILENFFPVYDATVVRKLTDQGGEIIGKTNCDAFAFGASTENSGFGATRNPWNLSKVAGGSSGGSAAAVAADECIFALGTDTGGSIRQPASFCNVVGLKPTYGACSRLGLLAMASSLDCPGPIAKTVEDCEIVFDLMKGIDSKDATTWENGGEAKKIGESGRKLIGLPKEFFSGKIDGVVKDIILKAADKFKELGYEIKEISLPHSDFAIAVYYIIVPSEISSNMARYTGVRFGEKREVFEDEVKRRIILGTYTLSAGYYDQYYLQATKVRSLIQQDYFEAFKSVDLILGPVSPTPPFGIGEKTDDPLKMYLADILTVGANLAGIPSVALPAGFTKDGLPVGMQILGNFFSEKILFATGKKYQQATDWHLKKPKI